ncbi:LRR and NB-ARC domains-containing disease resistance protein, partial [Prunus dulcis]
PDPISALEFEPNPTSAEISAESPLYFDQSQNFSPVKQSVHPSQQPEYLKSYDWPSGGSRVLLRPGGENSLKMSRASRRLPEPQTGEIRDYDQPVPPADSSMTPSQLESLWQDAGDRSQPDPQSWQVSGHQVCRAANPGTHGPSVPETREAKSSALT